MHFQAIYYKLSPTVSSPALPLPDPVSTAAHCPCLALPMHKTIIIIIMKIMTTTITEKYKELNREVMTIIQIYKI